MMSCILGLASLGTVGILFWLLSKANDHGAALVQTEHRERGDNDFSFWWAQAAADTNWANSEPASIGEGRRGW